MDSSDPFKHTSPPSIPPKSPERIALLKRNGLDPFNDDATQVSVQSRHKFSVFNPATVPVKLQKKSHVDSSNFKLKVEADTELNRSSIQPQSQTEWYCNPYSHGEAAEYGNHMIAKLNAGKRLSFSSSGTEGTRSLGISELDSDYVHPFARRAPGEAPFAAPKKDEIVKNAARGGVDLDGSGDEDGTDPQRSKARSSRFKESAIHDAPIPNHVTPATANREKRSNFKRRDSSLRQQKLLKTAIRQNFLLEQERRNTETKLRAETPQRSPSSLSRIQRGIRSHHKSTSSMSNLITRQEIIVGDGPRRGLEGSRAYHSPSFWKFFTVFIVSAGSTASSFAVALSGGKSQEPSTGLLIWMICSVICVIVGVTGCVCIWGFGNAKFVSFMSRTGMEELGLMPSFTETRTRSQEERDEGKRVLRRRMERIEERRLARRMGDVGTDNVGTLSEEWRVLYHYPGESGKAQPERSGNKREDVEPRALLRQPSRNSTGGGRKKSDMQVDHSWLMVEDGDIGSQFLTPTRIPHDQKVDRQSRSLLSAFKERIKSTQQVASPIQQHRVSTSTTTPPIADEVVITPSIRPFFHREISHNLSQELRFTPKISHIQSIIPLPQPNLTHSPTVELYTRAPPLPLNHSADTLDLAGTPVQTVSPLETLARELNTQELRSLSAGQRVEYFSSRREISEESGRRVKESLELRRMESITGGRSGLSKSRREDKPTSDSSLAKEIPRLGNSHRSQMGVLSLVSTEIHGRHDGWTTSSNSNSEPRNRIVSTIPTTITASPSTIPLLAEDVSSLSMYSQPSILTSLPDFLPPILHRSTSSMHSRPSTSSSSNQFLTVKVTGPLISERLRDLEQRADREGNGRSASLSSVSLGRVGVDKPVGRSVKESRSDVSLGRKTKGKGVDRGENANGGEEGNLKCENDSMVEQERKKTEETAGTPPWLLL